MYLSSILNKYLFNNVNRCPQIEALPNADNYVDVRNVHEGGAARPTLEELQEGEKRQAQGLAALADTVSNNNICVYPLSCL